MRVMAKNISPRTGYLFATPSSLHGAARVFDFWGVYDEYNLDESPDRDLATAVLQDWLVLADDAAGLLTPTPVITSE